MPRFSANLGFLWSELALAARIEAAANAGFRAVEFHWPYEIPASELKRLCADQQLAILGINTPVGEAEAGDFGLGAKCGREAEFRETFLRSADYANAVGAGYVHIMAGVVPASDREQARAVLLENLNFAARVAPEIKLLLEPINQLDKPGYCYSTLHEASDVIASLHAGNVKLMFDAYHVGRQEGDVVKNLQKYFQQIGHFQIASVPSRTEPNEGELNYSEVFRKLDELGYDGWVGCEYKPRASTDEGLSWIKELGYQL